MTNNEQRNFLYWIDIGRTNGQYTLHRRIQNRPTHWAHNEYTYVRNLGRVYDEAVERADAYIANLHTDSYQFGYVKDYAAGEGGELRHAGQYEIDTLWFGKYAGKALEDVAANDPEYLRYLRDNFDRNGKPKMKALLKAIDDMDLGQSERELARQRRIEERAREELEWHEIKQAIPTEVTEGRTRFVGEVVAIYTRDTMYGEQTKMIFKDERNFKLVGTAPRALWKNFDEDPIGCTIAFDAACDISEDDPAFGFYRRPTKIEIINETRS